jgi:hypothetical protein
VIFSSPSCSIASRGGRLALIGIRIKEKPRRSGADERLLPLNRIRHHVARAAFRALPPPRQLDDRGPWLVLGDEILDRPPVLMAAAVAVGAYCRDLAVACPAKLGTIGRFCRPETGRRLARRPRAPLRRQFADGPGRPALRQAIVARVPHSGTSEATRESHTGDVGSWEGAGDVGGPGATSSASGGRFRSGSSARCPGAIPEVSDGEKARIDLASNPRSGGLIEGPPAAWSAEPPN